ncbi:LytR/AlgR family response regulator transcription factor [Undibacterium fentianense]|uniref:Response regulator transcription factor n=1 Tax=Undibacterium fentianense TaxID=2828728 RepID=A0A941E2V9_9BURK|nr:LytTR family DNA-binding domain-containing protein [Undibacterium fentianense]MBR7801320.1 response regulator transcription factor [Undibacterium fentianense]
MKNKLSALIIDDEELARRLTREFLRHHSDIEIIGECDNGIQAVDSILASEPDLIFLDIQMPKLNGFEVLQATNRQQGVIFTTAYDQYALQAFDQHAVDYLLKPFSQQRFDEALNKARKLIGQSDSSIQGLIKQASTNIERILVKDRGQTFVIPTAQIDYIVAQDDYVQIHFAGRSLLKTQSLAELEKQLNAEQFVRIHRSSIIRLQALKCIERASKDSYQVVMHNGTILPISRSGHDRIKGML